MTRIIIDDVVDRMTLALGLRAVRREFEDASTFSKAEVSFGRFEMALEAGAGFAVVDGVRVGRLREPDQMEPYDAVRGTGSPFVPCPDRGRHQRVVECWRCWSDVMRGAALEVEVVDPRSWAPGPIADE